MPANFAVDGDMKTRWASASEDNQWWQADFDAPRNLCGLEVKWEYAFGDKYEVLAKISSGEWKKVYATSAGDGNTDIIYFEPVVASSVKLNLLTRGTGWSFSIWEINFLEGNPPEVKKSSDGAQVEIILPRPMLLGGLVHVWGDKSPRNYSLEGSSDMNTWKELFKTARGRVENWDYFDSIEVKALRIKCEGSGFEFKSFELKSSEEKVDLLKTYQTLAKDSPAGYFPMWLSRKQEFWTVVGIPGDREEGMLTETGAVEPFKNAFSVMPFVRGGKKLYTYNDCRLNQSLEKNYLPIPTVKWENPDFLLKITAVGTGTIGKSFSAVRYSFYNRKKDDFIGEFALAVRPLQMNPSWQHGGFTPIKTCECIRAKGSSIIRINGQPGVISLTDPAKMGALELDPNDIIDCISKGTLPDSITAKNSQGTVSAAAVYRLNLKPGERKDIIVIYPMEGGFNSASLTGFSFEKTIASETKRWTELVNRVYIEIPEKRLTDVLRSNLAYILLTKDGPWIMPGPRNYSHSWTRDSAQISTSLMQFGLVDQVRDWLEAITAKTWDNGYVPFLIFETGRAAAFENNGSPEGKELDSQGEYPYAVRNYYDYSGDMDYLKKVYPRTIQALRFASGLRHAGMTEDVKTDPAKAANYGILPGSNSHEGYFPGMHSFWDDFFVLRGFKDCIYLADLLSDSENSAWLRTESADFQKCIYASIQRVITDRKIDYIPGCTEKGDFDSTSTAIAIVAGGELENLPRPNLTNTFNRYYEEFSKGLDAKHRRTFTPYEVRSANAFVWMGQRQRALTMLRHFTSDSTRPYGWNHFAEVVYADPRTPSYLGDMPHTWVGSGYIDAVRNMLAYESNDSLILCAGIDPAWLKKGVTVKELPTNYGTISYTIKKTKHGIAFSVDGTAKPPKGFILRLPAGSENRDFTFNELPVKKEIGMDKFN